MSKNHEIIHRIRQQVFLPLFYHDSSSTSVETTRTLYSAGIRVIEYTNRGEFALENFKALKNLQADELPDLVVGIGTIKTPAQALDFIRAGADFIVAPVVDSEVAHLAEENNTLWIPGCMTPTEINNAGKLGASLVKLFPADVLGTGYVKAVFDLFPGQYFLATGWGNPTPENILNWLQSGVAALGLGGKVITRDLMDGREYEKLHNNIVELLRYIRQTDT